MNFRRLLLSRKRKLSELYYATVSWGDLETTVHNPQYQEKERLFLDANDIQKYAYHCHCSTEPFSNYMALHSTRRFADY